MNLSVTILPLSSSFIRPMTFFAYGKRTIGAVTTCVEPSLDIISNVFIEIISLDVVNEGVSVHITQLKILAMGTSILQLHVVMMDFVHNDLTKIEDGLPKVYEFVHYDSDLYHFAPCQVSLNYIPDLKFSFITLLRYASSFVMRLITLCFLMFSIVFQKPSCSLA